MSNSIESELVYTYQMTHNGPFHFPRDEIEAGRFWSAQEIIHSIEKDIFTPNFEQEFGKLKKAKVIG